MTHVPLPFAEEVEELPEVTGAITYETDRYDGPIGGFIESNGALYRFDWVTETRDASRDMHAEARLFALRAIPEARVAELRSWIEKDRTLSDEAMLLNNPHVYPVSEWQKQRMRSGGDVQQELEAHGKLGGWWDALPVTHSMRGFGEQFAAVSMHRVTKATWEAYEAWRTRVANALALDEFGVLATLMASPPMAVEANTLFVVRMSGGTHLCDAKGKTLGPHFWMTARHRIEDITSFVGTA